MIKYKINSRKVRSIFKNTPFEVVDNSGGLNHLSKKIVNDFLNPSSTAKIKGAVYKKNVVCDFWFNQFMDDTDEYYCVGFMPDCILIYHFSKKSGSSWNLKGGHRKPNIPYMEMKLNINGNHTYLKKLTSKDIEIRER